MPPRSTLATGWVGGPTDREYHAYQENDVYQDVPRPKFRQETRHDTRPSRRHVSSRILVPLPFWAVLAASAALWWLNNRTATTTGISGALIAAGRLAGLVSGVLLLVVILAMSRMRWLECWYGADDALRWHRRLGGALVVLVPAHGALIVAGQAAAAGAPLRDQTITMIRSVAGVRNAAIAASILIVVGLLSARPIRRRLPYELWHACHLSLYLVVILGYGHQLTLGAELIRPGYARWSWMGLHALVGACLVWGRLVRPALLNLRHRLRVVEVVQEANDWASIYVEGRRLDKLRVSAGQYFRWRFLTRGCWWQAHPFSISAAPNGTWLRLTVKVVGRHTRDLQDLDLGVRVLVSGPSGTFTPGRQRCRKALLVAAGSGIGPVISLLEALPERTMVLYRAHSERDLVMRDELEEFAERLGSQVYFVVGCRDEHWPRRAFTPAGLRELVPDVTERDVYLCGPAGLVRTVVRSLHKIGVRRSQIHTASFEL